MLLSGHGAEGISFHQVIGDQRIRISGLEQRSLGVQSHDNEYLKQVAGLRDN